MTTKYFFTAAYPARGGTQDGTSGDGCCLGQCDWDSRGHSRSSHLTSTGMDEEGDQESRDHQSCHRRLASSVSKLGGVRERTGRRNERGRGEGEMERRHGRQKEWEGERGEEDREKNGRGR